MDKNERTTMERLLEEITYFPFEGGILQIELPQQPYSLEDKSAVYAIRR